MNTTEPVVEIRPERFNMLGPNKPSIYMKYDFPTCYSYSRNGSLLWLNSTSQVQTKAFCCRDDVRHYKTVFNQLNYT